MPRAGATTGAYHGICAYKTHRQLDHSFPSPGSTPTNVEFPGNHAHHTPKTAIFPTYFQDAFSTPQMPGYGTPQQPQHASVTPKRLQQHPSTADTLRSNFYANFQAQSSQNGMSIPSQTGPQNASEHWGPQNAMVQPGSSMDSSQIQTPPPTRGSSSKKMAHSDQIAFGTPSTIASRRFTTPQHQQPVPFHVGIASQTPVQFPQLQFSPDMYYMSSQGPATAPVLTQSRLLWEQQTSPTNFTQQASIDDPFSTLVSQNMSWSATSMDQSNVQAFSFDTPAMNSFPVQPPHPRPASPMQLSSIPSLQPSAPVSSGVNPSLVYSSPAQASTGSSSRTSRTKPSAKESKKDNTMMNQSRAASNPKIDSGRGHTVPALRRSNTTDSIRSNHSHATLRGAEALNRTNDFTHIPRTSSPLKRVGRTPLGSISEASKGRQRPSVTLVVDENGRARAQTTKPPESPTTRSMRERYPGLWDCDSSDEELEEEEQPLNRAPSFSFTKGGERRQKTARLDPPIENLEGLSLPRSSSSASMRATATPSKAAMSAAAQLRRQSSLRKGGPPARRTSARKDLATRSTSSLIDTAPMDLSAERHATAEAELRAQQRQQQSHSATFTQSLDTNTHELSAIEAHNRRWGSMSADQQDLQQHYPPQPPAFYNPAPPVHQLPFAMQPQATQAPLQIRCVCGVYDAPHNQPLLQCKSCTQWLHALCLGLDAQMPPREFTCFLCTRPASGRGVG